MTIETYRVEVDGLDSDLPPNSTLGTSNPIVDIVVNPNATTTNLNFGFDPGIADLSITKSANVTSAEAGDIVIWTIEVTNDGNGSPSGVRVSEIIPNGFEYISDSAPATGDVYDRGLGIWYVDEILVGATETLTITTRALSGGTEDNYAEIIYSSLPDPDSDFTVGRLNDDFNDGILDDDETQATVTLGPSGAMLSGTVFEDNGVGAVAHDAILGGAETGQQIAAVNLYDSGNVLLATVPVNAAGEWQFSLPSTYSGSIRVEALPLEGWLTVSEQTAGLPGLSNTDLHDGTFTFTPVSGTSYAALDFGFVETPLLTESQTRSIAAGQSVLVSHVYTATSSASVSFAYTDVFPNPADAFSATLFRDTACDGTPDSVVSAPISVVAGDSICVLSRVVASSGAGPGAQITYGLNASTSFTGTTVVSLDRNDDTLTVGSGELSLTKTVRNVTKMTAAGTENSGEIGDVLEYRLSFVNPSNQSITDVKVNDQTPAYTALTAPLPTSVVTASGISCTLTMPTNNVAGYEGAIEWQCPGSLLPGAGGELSFQVTISP